MCSTVDGAACSKSVLKDLLTTYEVLGMPCSPARSDRRLLTVTRALVGLEPISITISDQVWNFRSASVLLRLKPASRTHVFRLAGGTDVHGLMVGEIGNRRTCEELIRVRIRQQRDCH